MKNFKGFDDYVEIFRGGKQIDSGGKEHDGDALIDKAIETFDADYHEPPLVVGHPKDNDPAFGWVQDLKVETVNGGKVLFMKARDVVPEFEDLVNQGLYKKRSASFYPDGRLRHVGFLGAVPPAVKGLADLKFEDQDEALYFDFYDAGLGVVARMFRRLRDWLIEKEGKETADSIIPDWDVEYMQDEAKRPQPEPEAVQAFNEPGSGKPTKEDTTMAGEEKSFTEADLEQAKETSAAEARKDERKKVEAEFAEKERKQRANKRDQEIADYCEKGVKEGTIAPAWVDAGLKEFMQSLEGEEQIEFSEDNKQTPLGFFKSFLEELPRLVDFDELAGRDKDVGPADMGADEIAVKAREFQETEAKAGRTITVTQAVAHVTGKGK